MMFAVFVGYVFGWMAGGREYVLAGELRDRGVVTQGQIQTVTNGDSLNSPSASYQFEVNGSSVSGFSHIGRSLRNQLGPGSQVRVLYLAEDPHKSGIDLEGMAESGRHSIQIALVIEVVIGAFFLAMMFTKAAPRSYGITASRSNPTKGSYAVGMVILSIMLSFGVLMLFGAALPDFQKARLLNQSPEAAVGQITDVHTRSKGRGLYAQYSFKVGDAYYHGSFDYQGSYGDRGSVEVYYLPSDPSYSAPYPLAKLANARFGLYFLSVWNLVILAIIAAVYRRWRSARTI